MKLPLSRTLTIADALTKQLKLFLSPYTPNATVQREYSPKLDDDSFQTWINEQKSMGVFIVPISKKSMIHTRSEDELQHTYGVIFAEKCQEEDGVPSNEWMDSRVSLVDAVEQKYGDLRNAWNDQLGVDIKAVESEITLVFDSDVHRQCHAFYSVWTVTLSEIVVA